MRRRQPSGQIKKIARTRIEWLWAQSRGIVHSRSDLAREWMIIARRVAQKARIKMPLQLNRMLCKRCGSLFMTTSYCRVRIRNNRGRHITVTCLNCGLIRRFPVRQKY